MIIQLGAYELNTARGQRSRIDLLLLIPLSGLKVHLSSLNYGQWLHSIKRLSKTITVSSNWRTAACPAKKTRWYTVRLVTRCEPMKMRHSCPAPQQRWPIVVTEWSIFLANFLQPWSSNGRTEHVIYCACVYDTPLVHADLRSGWPPDLNFNSSPFHRHVFTYLTIHSFHLANAHISTSFMKCTSNPMLNNHFIEFNKWQEIIQK